MKKIGVKAKILCILLAAVLMLPQTPVQPAVVKAAATADAEWWNFRNTETNNAVTDRPTPTSDTEAWEKWSVRYGTGYKKSPTPPIIVNGRLYIGVDNQIIEVSKDTGEALRYSAEMPGNVGYAMQSPVYADGKIFVAITQGRVCAINLSDLSLAWTTDNRQITAGQTVSPISYVNINGTGYIYTGTWTTNGGDLLCATTDDSDVTDGIKQLTWHFNPAEKDAEGLAANNSVAVGYYWTGAYVCENYLAIGSDNGSQDGKDISDTAFYTLNPKTGEIIDVVYGIHGQVRSTAVYQNGYLYFSTKDAKVYKIKVDSAGKMSAVSYVDLAETAGAESSTATPVVYDGKIYFGVQGKGGQFSSDGGHGFAVVRDDAALTSQSFLYVIPVPGYPQAGALLSNSHVREDFNGDGSPDGRVYLFFTYNALPGGIFYTYDTPGQTEPTKLTAEEARIFVPSSGKQQYCISSIVADREGTLYYKNDSGYVFAVESNPAALNDLQLKDEAGNEVALEQTFRTKLAEYSATVASSVDALKIRLQYAEGAAVTVAGKAYTEDIAIPLQAEKTEIPIVVTKGGKSRTYTLTVVKKSGNANLSALASAKGNNAPAGNYVREITPAFDKDVTEYKFNWIATGTDDDTDPAYGSNSRIMNLFLAPENGRLTYKDIRVWPGENCKQPSSASESDGSVKYYTMNGSTGYKYRYPVYADDITKDSTARIQVTAEDGTVKEYNVTFVRTEPEVPEEHVHEWGEWEIVTEATTEETGLERRVCKTDERHVEEREIPKKVDSGGSTPGTPSGGGTPGTPSGGGTPGTPSGGGTQPDPAEEPLETVKEVAPTETIPGNIRYYYRKHADGTITYYKDSDKGDGELITIKVEDAILPATGHMLELRPAVEASCASAGNKAYYECTGCGKLFEDKEGTKEIEKREMVVIPATRNHTWDTGAVVKEASAGVKGERVFTCTVCEAQKSEEIPALPAAETVPVPSGTAGNTDVNAITPSERAANNAKVSKALAGIAANKITVESSLSRRRMSVRWNASANAVNYRVAWKTASESKWHYLWSGKKPGCTISKLKKGNCYEIRVCAYRKNSGTWVRSEWSDVIRQYFQTGSKIKLKAGKKAITVSWKKDSKASGYQILYSLKKNMKNAKTVTVGKKKTSCKLNKLKRGKVYYIQVRPIRKYSGKKFSGVLSAKKKTRVK